MDAGAAILGIGASSRDRGDGDGDIFAFFGGLRVES
jgi:hypothetical protein